MITGCVGDVEIYKFINIQARLEREALFFNFYDYNLYHKFFYFRKDYRFLTNYSKFFMSLKSLLKFDKKCIFEYNN